jgi:hypothetical protein
LFLIELSTRFGGGQTDNLTVSPNHDLGPGPFSYFDNLLACITTRSSYLFVHRQGVVFLIGANHMLPSSKDWIARHTSTFPTHSSPFDLLQITSGGVTAPFKTYASSTIGK